MKHEKKCVCTDKDPYTCYYERYLEVFHKKYPDEGEEPEVEDVLFTNVIYCLVSGKLLLELKKVIWWLVDSLLTRVK